MTTAALPLLKLAHRMLEEVIRPGDRVIDATLGNGHDALFLAKLVSPNGRIYGFDVQELAIESTRKRLMAAEIGESVFELHGIGHERLDEFVKEPVKAVVFNLGYLPSADKSVITASDTTLQALEKAKDLIAVNGLLSVMCYPGHKGGDAEAEAVTSWFRDLENRSWNVIKHQKLNVSSDAPFLITAFRCE